MLIESIIGNLYESPEPVLAEVDWTDFFWTECGKRALRKRSRAGRAVRILLPIGQSIRHGDVLAHWPATGERLVAHVVPTQVLVGHTSSPQVLATLAYELGNLHAPIQLQGGEILTPPDGPVEAVFARLGVDCTREVRRFLPHPVAGIQPTLSASFEIVHPG